MSSLWDSPSSNASEPPSSNQTEAQLNLACSGVEVSGSSALLSSSLDVSPNNQIASPIETLLMGLLSKYTQREREFIWVKVIPLVGGLNASPLYPTIIPPSGSSSTFTSTSSNFNSFSTCNKSYEKRGIAH